MKNCIVIPDSFKGTMSAIEVCQVMTEGIASVFPDCHVYSVPIADGGEGTVDCFLHSLSGTKEQVRVKDPFGETIDSFYGLLDDRDTAVIEMAAAAGLNLAYGKLNPLKASTYGVGQLIKHAVESGCTKIILGLGGSCTNDGGAGMAVALGTRFYDERGNSFVPTGDTLDAVVGIDNSRTEELLKGVKIEAMCDITNPMFGERGAAYVFAPQKGANQQEVLVLDENLRKFADRIEEILGINVAEIPGAGAAGAMGAGVYAFLKGKLISGIELLLDMVDFDHMLKGCDVVFTGEGKLDHQSFGGKVIAGVTSHARKRGVPVIVVSGCMENGIQKASQELGISRICPVYGQQKPLAEILPTCKDDLRRTVTALAGSLAI